MPQGPRVWTPSGWSGMEEQNTTVAREGGSQRKVSGNTYTRVEKDEKAFKEKGSRGKERKIE